MTVVALIGDIIKSRSLQHREHVQQDIERALTAVAKQTRTKLLSPYTVTLGDEFQAVFKGAENLFMDIWLLLYLLHPLHIRLSIGVGDLSTRLNRKRAIGMDGPAFHLARMGIANLKLSRESFRLEEPVDRERDWINPALSVIGHMSATWRKPRLFILHRILAGETPKMIAKRSSLTLGAVYKNIDAGALRSIAEIFKTIERTIDNRDFLQ